MRLFKLLSKSLPLLPTSLRSMGRGLWLGTKNGFVWSVLFTLWGFFSFSLVSAFVNQKRDSLEIITYIWGEGFVYGILPATLLGAVTGTMLGIAVTWLPKPKGEISKWVSLLPALLLWLFFWFILVGMVFHFEMLAVIFFMFPSIIYFFVNCWMGYILYLALLSEQTKQVTLVLPFLKIQGGIFVLAILICVFPWWVGLPISGLVVAVAIGWKRVATSANVLI